MKNIVLTSFILLSSYSIFSQEIDSLKILKDNDWRTMFRWFDRDTVYLQSIPKIDTIYLGLTIRQKINKKIERVYGERISFDSGELKYSNNWFCMVGESLKKVNSIELIGQNVIVDFEIKPWSSKIKDWISSRIKYEIIKWSPKYIILQQE